MSLVHFIIAYTIARVAGVGVAAGLIMAALDDKEASSMGPIGVGLAVFCLLLLWIDDPRETEDEDTTPNQVGFRKEG